MRNSHFTKWAYYISVIAICVLFLIGLRYTNLGISEYEKEFGQLTLLEGFFALFGLIIIDYFYDYEELNPLEKKFKPLTTKTMLLTGVITTMLILIQIVTQMVPITVRPVDIALSIVFAGVAEELFFRGILIGSSIKLSEFIRKQSIINLKFLKGTKIGKRDISIIDIMSIILSSLFFGAMHQNYYGDAGVLLATFLSGFMLGTMYWYFRDISANIFAHFILNMIAGFQMLAGVSL